ncbi:MAG: PD40 domain-containing protein [Anaerolineae bacterium]|nr:PD40 domain-containing protein [Anaerolineae bacterium]
MKLRLGWIAFCLRLAGSVLTGCAGLIAAASAVGMGRPGDALYFISSRDGLYRIYAHDLDHHFTRRLSSEPVALSYLNLSPDGRILLFEAGTERSAWPLGARLMNWDGSGARPFPIEDAHGLRWSPDGRWIVATRVVDEQNVLFLVEAACVVSDSACPEPIQITAGGFSAGTPSWSPDGSWLAYAANPRGDYDLFVLDLGCLDEPGGCIGQGRGVGQSEADDVLPQWSPDGRSLLFGRLVGLEVEMYLIDPFASGPARALAGEMHTTTVPAWSPNGERIAFFSERLYVMDVPGGVPRALEDRTGSWPVWSRDGERIAYVSGLELLSPHIRLVDLAGRGQVLFEDGFTYWAPVWWGRE